MTNVLAYPAFDADNHYYEAQDAFTRHLPKGYAFPLRAVGDNRQQAASPGGRKTRPCSEESNLEPDFVARIDRPRTCMASK
jgi:hypothetical protein